MKANTTIINALNKLLAAELTAMDQYFIHSRMFDDWGLSKLFERIDHEFDDEKGHASALIERILFLEGTPDLRNREPLRIGHDVPSMLRNDLQLEYDVAATLKETIAICEREQDFHSRRILGQLLEDTEVDHAYWLEKQLRLIDKIGLQNYLQSQIA